jgi:hypothetical protein
MAKMPELKSKSDLDAKNNPVSVAEECEGFFKNVVKKIEEVYVEGTLKWVEENDPELARELREAEDELNRVWRANIDGKSSILEFKQALKRYFGANLKANERYKCHF